MALGTAGKSAIRKMIETHNTVKHGNLSGRRIEKIETTGQLPQYLISHFQNASYAIYSYRTPIAWVDGDGVWYVPAGRYSVSTTNHQSAVRTALRSIAQTVGEI